MIVAVMVAAGCACVVAGLWIEVGVWLGLVATGLSLLAGAWLTELKLRELAAKQQEA